MHQFRNDYSEGAAPAILDALVRTNLEQCVGYGADDHCAHAAELIRFVTSWATPADAVSEAVAFARSIKE